MYACMHCLGVRLNVCMHCPGLRLEAFTVFAFSRQSLTLYDILMQQTSIVVLTLYSLLYCNAVSELLLCTVNTALSMLYYQAPAQGRHSRELSCTLWEREKKTEQKKTEELRNTDKPACNMAQATRCPLATAATLLYKTAGSMPNLSTVNQLHSTPAVCVYQPREQTDGSYQRTNRWVIPENKPMY